MKNYIKIAAFFALGLIVTSCDDFFNVNPDDTLLEKDYPNSIAELYSGYMGVTAKVQAVADLGIYLEGLRGDYLEPTPNSPDDILDLYHYNETNTNSFADPYGYYAVILNANDYLEHACRFHEKNPKAVEDATFEAFIAGTVRFKCWAYLQLAKIYGQAVWVDDPMTEYKDLSNYQTLNFEGIIEKCINVLETGVDIHGVRYSSKSTVRWTDVLNVTDLNWNRYCPPADCLLTELYLFAENYEKTFEYGSKVLMSGKADSETKPSFQLTNSEWNGEWSKLFATLVRSESIFGLSYDYDSKQTNHIVEYFYDDPVCKYYFRPSQAAMDRHINQIRNDGMVGDQYRGNGKTFTQSAAGNWIIRKYPVGTAIYRNETPITLYRAADIHLWIAEALVHLSKGEWTDATGTTVPARPARLQEAAAFLDGGIKTDYDVSAGAFLRPYEDFPTSLYGSSTNITEGVRGRVSLKKMATELWKPYPATAAEVARNQFSLDSLIVEETCMESACEARAYYAMIRCAKRWNKPEVVADRVSAKYPESERARIHALLMNPENWYIKRVLK